jgi:hypothetical protein
MQKTKLCKICSLNAFCIQLLLARNHLNLQYKSAIATKPSCFAFINSVQIAIFDTKPPLACVQYY